VTLFCVLRKLFSIKEWIDGLDCGFSMIVESRNDCTRVAYTEPVVIKLNSAEIQMRSFLITFSTSLFAKVIMTREVIESRRSYTVRAN
jgi:hypothetical protein